VKWWALAGIELTSFDEDLIYYEYGTKTKKLHAIMDLLPYLSFHWLENKLDLLVVLQPFHLTVPSQPAQHI
jgi:hypothetical protein